MRAISLAPLTARLKARLLGQREFLSLARSVEQIAPASEAEVPPAIALAGEFERATVFERTTTLEQHINRLAGGVRAQGPTLSYRFDNALLADHTVFANGGYAIYRSGGNKRAVLAGRTDVYEEAQLCTTNTANMYFGHWLHDTLPLELLANRRGLEPLSFRHPPWMHEPGYRHMLGMDPVMTNLARVRRLDIVDDKPLNSGWIKRFTTLRSRVRQQTESNGPSHVLILRGVAGASRELANAPELMEELSRRGFEIIEPERMQPRAISSALANARVAVSVTGSALSHAQIALPASSAIVAIQPPTLFGTFQKVLADCSGIRFGYVVGDPQGKGFAVNSQRLLRTLDLVEAAI